MTTKQRPTLTLAKAGQPPVTAQAANVTAQAVIAQAAAQVANIKPQSAVQAPAQATASEAINEVKGTMIPHTEELQADPMLIRILSTCRAHGSDGDQQFRMWLFNHLKAMKLNPIIKIEGNIYVETDPKSTVLFSCHVDTVHRQTEVGPQELAFDPTFGHIFLADKKKNTCLGGDDGVGVYIMLKMLEAGVKGKYMFHTGEERGGIGSRAFVRENRLFCEDLELVVAFDRAVRSGDNPEVIHSQGGRRCASDEFSKALCDQLNEHGDFDLPYVLSSKGSFTDSKVYADIVPECVNVGCFYERQHTSEEYVDIVGLEKLVKAAIATKWSMLPIIRKPEPEKQYTPTGFGGTYSGGKSSSAGLWDDMPDFYKGNKANGSAKSVAAKPKVAVPKVPALEPELSILDELRVMNRSEIEMLCMEDSDIATNFIVELLIENAGLRGQQDALRNLLG